MSLISLLVLIAVIGLVAWALRTYVPMPPSFQNLIVVVAIVAVVFIVLNAFGLLDGLWAVHVGAPGRR